MSEKKHSGENTAGVTVQIRLVPLNVDKEEETKTATISVWVDDAQKGTLDNLRVLELPMISKLELEGETLVLNKIKLINTIIHPKDQPRDPRRTAIKKGVLCCTVCDVKSPTKPL